MFKGRSLQSKLFLSYSGFLVLLLLLIAAPSYIYVYNNMVNSTDESLRRSVSNISLKLDRFIETSESITKQIYTNNKLRDAIEAINDSSDETKIGEAYKEINADIQLISWIYSQLSRITFFNSKGDIFSDKHNDIRVWEAFKTDTLENIRKKRGGPTIGYYQRDNWLNNGKGPIFSFMRLLTYNGNGLGFLEIQISLANVIDRINPSHIRNGKLLVFNDESLLYPVNDNEISNSFISENYRKIITNKKNGELNLRLKNGKNEHIVFIHSAVTGYYTLYAVPYNEMYNPLKYLKIAAAIVIVTIICITLIVYYIILRKFTKPLRELRNALNSTDILSSKIEIENSNNNDEVELLNKSFESMRIRLKNTMNEIVSAKTLQLETHFEVLQAQMNPHFLFNILGIISISCEKNGARDAAGICRKLSSFLRYSVSTTKTISTIKEELEFTHEYLELMKHRYTHRLNYTIAVEEGLLDFLIPRLTLQPLVENCIAHGFENMDGDMEIKIEGIIFSDRWEIKISDNGVGFTEDVLESIRRKYESYMENLSSNSQVEKLSIGGMGIVNTLARLKLLLRDKVDFEIGNNEKKGAAVKIIGFEK